jgi:hypothetical protein
MRWGGSRRNAFWAQVQQQVGCTQLAKIIINYGVGDVDVLSFILFEVVLFRKSAMHANLKAVNRYSLSATERKLRADVRCCRSTLRYARKENYDEAYIHRLEMQNALKIDRFNRSKRPFVDITAAAECMRTTQRNVVGRASN